MVLDLDDLDAPILQFKSDFRVETIKPKAVSPKDGATGAKWSGSFSTFFAKPQCRLPIAILPWSY
jgi:hypothetical protein